MKKLKIALIVYAWDSVFQRPHHWKKQALACGHEVHIFTSNRALKNIFKMNGRTAIHRIPFNFYEFFLRRIGKKREAKLCSWLRFENFVRKTIGQKNNQFDVMLYCSIPMSNFNREAFHGLFIYDCMDDWNNFPLCKKEIVCFEEEMMKQSDLILTVSEILYKRWNARYEHSKIMLVPNGCDYDFFAANKKLFRTDDEFVIGYTGVIAEWFNWDIVLSLAKNYPKALIQLVGPVFVNVPHGLPSHVRLLGERSYEKMPQFIDSFDVCIIPFSFNSPLVESTSPIKLYEYLACGKPVVTVPMVDCARFKKDGVVYIADNLDLFVKEVARAKELSNNPELIKHRRSIAFNNSWKIRWKQIEEKIESLIKT